jgi:hypothetical protein
MEQLALALLRAVRCVLAEASDSAAAAPAGTAAEFVKELVQVGGWVQGWDVARGTPWPAGQACGGL